MYDYDYDYDDDKPTRAELRAEEAQEVWEDAVYRCLAPMVAEALAERVEFLEGIGETPDEDAIREELEESLLEDAEEEARWYLEANTPCCNDFHCDCGNYSTGPR